MRRLIFYIVLEALPLIGLLIGGMFMPADQRRELLMYLAGRIDKSTRGLHDRVSDELDSLGVATR